MKGKMINLLKLQYIVDYRLQNCVTVKRIILLLGFMSFFKPRHISKTSIYDKHKLNMPFHINVGMMTMYRRGVTIIMLKIIYIYIFLNRKFNVDVSVCATA